MPRELAAVSAIGQYAAAQEIMKLARDRAPIGPSPDPQDRAGHPGALKAGAYVRPPNVRFAAGGSASVEMGFEGLPHLYMVKQHEETGYEHPQGGEAKFFETAVLDRAKETTRIIAFYVDTYIRTGRAPPMPAADIPTQGQ
jgi:hypothetical protein